MTEDQIKGLTAEQASQEISRLTSEAYAAIAQAEAIANVHKLSFEFGVAYGMGGTYYGDEEDRHEYCSDGWYSSSNC